MQMLFALKKLVFTLAIAVIKVLKVPARNS